MRLMTWAIILAWFLSAPPSRAQQPVPASLDDIKKVFVPVAANGLGDGFEQLLTDRLKEWGKFEIVSSSNEAHGVLIALYGCDPFIFHSVVAVSRTVGWTICDVRLLDADLAKRGIEPEDATVWEMPQGLLQDLYLPEPNKTKIATGIAGQLIKDWEISAGVRQPDIPPALPRVNSIYVAKGDVSDSENVLFEKLLLGRLLKTSKGNPIGDCDSGYESVIPNVKVVCHVWKADAMLVSLGIQEIDSRTRYEGTDTGSYSGSANISCDDLTSNCSGTTKGTVTMRRRGQIIEDRG